LVDGAYYEASSLMEQVWSGVLEGVDGILLSV
jgi:hypothetical protein